HTFSSGVTLKTAGTRSITATDTITASINGTQSNITVNAAGAASLVVTSEQWRVGEGNGGRVTVTVKDSFGNTVTGYTGMIHFTSSDAQALLPANYTFVGADNGTHTFSNAVTLKTAGTQLITATDTVTASINGTQSNITVNAAGAASLVVAGFPSPTTAGNAGSVTVTAKDSFGNTVTGYTGTIHFTSSDAQAVL